MHSLRFRLFGLWALSVIASAVVGLLFIELYRQSTEAQVGRAEAVVAHACDLIRDRYAFYAAGWTGPLSEPPNEELRAGLATAAGLALTHQDGVEGGIWQAGAGPLAYAYPTYEGSGPKTDLPAAERDQIQAINQRAAKDDQPADHRVTARAQTLLLYSCPLHGPIPKLTAWTMTRVQGAEGLHVLRLGAGVLLGLLALMTAWLGRTAQIWGRHIRDIESALGKSGIDGLPEVPRTGERELDRIIDALNDAGRRLSNARQISEALALRVASAERLAALGRVAAGVAHEIRNPIAAARLQGENALAGDDARRREAISEMLVQIGRLEALAGELLAMTQRVEPKPVSIELAAFLEAQASRHQDIASIKKVAIGVSGSGPACFDPLLVGRVLDNLLTNAVRHAPEGGSVFMKAERQGCLLTFCVEDTGPGVGAGLAEHLFEPFVTSRADGTGLGLAIARELADAHGGRLLLQVQGGEKGGRGALFALELPQENPCPPF